MKRLILFISVLFTSSFAATFSLGGSTVTCGDSPRSGFLGVNEGVFDLCTAWGTSDSGYCYKPVGNGWLYFVCSASCPTGQTFDTSTQSCECSTGYHWYQDTCIQDDQCLFLEEQAIAQCDSSYGSGNYDLVGSCSYDAVTGESTSNYTCSPYSSSSAAVSSAAVSSVSVSSASVSSTAVSSSAVVSSTAAVSSAATSTAATSSGSATSSGTATSASTSSSGLFCSTIEVPNKDYCLEECFADQAHTIMISSQNVECLGVDNNGTAEIVDAIDKFSDRNHDDLSDINSTLGNRSVTYDPCKAISAFLEFRSIDNGAQWAVYQKYDPQTGMKEIGDCVCITCYIRNPLTGEGCVPDPSCTQSSSSSSSSEPSELQRFHEDMNQSFDRLLPLASDMNSTLNQIGNDLNKNHNDLNSTLSKLGSDLNGSLSLLHADLNKTNNLLGEINDFINGDSNESTDSYFSDINVSIYQSLVDSMVSEVGDFVTNVSGQFERIKSEFSQLLSLDFSAITFNLPSGGGAAGCFQASAFGATIDLDPCPVLSKFAPIFTFIITVLFLFMAIRMMINSVERNA